MISVEERKMGGSRFVTFDLEDGSRLELPVVNIAYASLKNTAYTPLLLMVVTKKGQVYYPQTSDQVRMLELAASIWAGVGAMEDVNIFVRMDKVV